MNKRHESVRLIFCTLPHALQIKKVFRIKMQDGHGMWKHPILIENKCSLIYCTRVEVVHTECKLVFKVCASDGFHYSEAVTLVSLNDLLSSGVSAVELRALEQRALPFVCLFIIVVWSHFKKAWMETLQLLKHRLTWTSPCTTTAACSTQNNVYTEKMLF